MGMKLRHRKHRLYKVPPASRMLVRASAVLGSIEAAKAWLETPAIGLNQLRPCELLRISEGRAQIAMLLGRMEYGIYC